MYPPHPIHRRKTKIKEAVSKGAHCIIVGLEKAGHYPSVGLVSTVSKHPLACPTAVEGRGALCAQVCMVFCGPGQMEMSELGPALESLPNCGPGIKPDKTKAENVAQW